MRVATVRKRRRRIDPVDLLVEARVTEVLVLGRLFFSFLFLVFSVS